VFERAHRYLAALGSHARRVSAPELGAELPERSKLGVQLFPLRPIVQRGGRLVQPLRLAFDIAIGGDAIQVGPKRRDPPSEIRPHESVKTSGPECDEHSRCRFEDRVRILFRDGNSFRYRTVGYEKRVEELPVKSKDRKYERAKEGVGQACLDRV
jgi:hypothetical protein